MVFSCSSRPTMLSPLSLSPASSSSALTALLFFAPAVLSAPSRAYPNCSLSISALLFDSASAAASLYFCTSPLSPSMSTSLNFSSVSFAVLSSDLRLVSEVLYLSISLPFSVMIVSTASLTLSSATPSPLRRFSITSLFMMLSFLGTLLYEVASPPCT